MFFDAFVPVVSYKTFTHSDDIVPYIVYCMYAVCMYLRHILVVCDCICQPCSKETIIIIPLRGVFLGITWLDSSTSLMW